MIRLDALQSISRAVLYEGCMLYPYRPSALKNQRPGWTFGALLPPAYAAANPGEADTLQTQVLEFASGENEIAVEVRFLQLGAGGSGSSIGISERTVALSAQVGDLVRCSQLERFSFPIASRHSCGSGETLDGSAELAAEHISETVVRITLRVLNLSLCPENCLHNRDSALHYALLSANALMAVSPGEFISVLDPPDSLRSAVAQCRQVGVVPVLAGDPAARSAMLISPIILYDFPQIAAESPGDFFDSSEIDEMLALRMLTLSDEERAEVHRASAAGSAILRRTEAMSADSLRSIHGTFRSR